VPGEHAYDYRVQLMLKQIAELFRDAPGSLEDFAFASQAVQAEAMKFFIERFRMGKWRRTGLLWWNVLDGWPQFSDAVVDYYFVRKLAYDFIRRSQQDVAVCLDEPDSWVQRLVVCNDTRCDLKLDVEVRDLDSGDVLFSGPCAAPADASAAVAEIPYVRNRQRFLLIHWSGDAEGSNHYLSGQPPFDAAQYRDWLQRSGLYEETLKTLE
jgi:beta-mannosidase